MKRFRNDSPWLQQWVERYWELWKSCQVRPDWSYWAGRLQREVMGAYYRSGAETLPHQLPYLTLEQRYWLEEAYRKYPSPESCSPE